MIAVLARTLAMMGIIASVTACTDHQVFEESKAILPSSAISCLSLGVTYSSNCVGSSVVLSGFITDYEGNGYRISITNPLSDPVPGEGDDFIAVTKGYLASMQGKVRVKGVITQSASSKSLVVSIFSIENEELTLAESRARAARERTPYLSPERQVALAREMGARALEEADAAIRQNNGDIKKAIAAKALTHHRSNSTDLLVDVYGMPDGRHIACKTVIYATGAPIVTCDGEP